MAMAIGSFNFFSKSLSRAVPFNIILPNDIPEMYTADNENFKRNMKTLYLLDGFSAGNTDWMLNTNINQLASKYNLCVVFPYGENSFYLDAKETGRKYGTYIGEELVEYTRKTFGLSAKAEDTFVGGLSMGGFGAIHTGLMYNHTFSKLFALSSALIIHGYEKMERNIDNGIANYEYYESIFGDRDKVATSSKNPEELVRRIQKNGDVMPKMFLACGTNDFLINENREFKEFLQSQNVEFTYEESEGVHDFEFWGKMLEPAIQWLLK